MKGLKGVLIKDIGLVKNQLLIVLFIIIIYAIAFGFSDNVEAVAAFAGSYSVIIMSMLPVTLLSFDEKNKWGRYSAAMPVSRKANVASKYIIMLGMSLINAVVMGIVYYVTGIDDMIVFIIFLLGASLFVGSIVTVLAYKFGSNYARFIFMGIFVVVFILFATAARGLGDFLGKLFTLDAGNFIYAAIVFLAFSILVSISSMMASMHIYENKDF